MPPDIRSFFGGKPASSTQSSQEKTPAKKADSSTANKKTRGSRRVVEDSDDDVQEVSKKTTPKKPTPRTKAGKESPKGEAVTTSAYFASSKKKPNRSSTTRADAAKKEATPTASPKNISARSTKTNGGSPAKASVKGRATSTRQKKPTTSYAEYDDEDDDAFLDDKDDGDDVFTADFKKRGKGFGDDYEEDEDQEEDVLPRRRSGGRGKQTSILPNEKEAAEDGDIDMKDTDPDDVFIVPDDDEEIIEDKPAKHRNATTANRGRKRKSIDVEDEEDPPVVSSTKPKGASAKPPQDPPAKKARATPKKKEPVTESKEMQEILDSIPTVRPPTPPQQSGEPKKFNYRDHAQSRGQPAPAAGSVEMPTGAENCLAGLTFVFTGLLEALSRDEGQELVKRYGGKVTTAPSTKTSYVVLGSEAGPKKLETIRKNNIKTINEEGLFELIKKLPANGGSGVAAEKHAEKQAKEAEKVKQMAAEMEKEDRRTGGAGGAGSGAAKPAVGKASQLKTDSRLWTVKYAPSSTTHICGNKTQVERLQRWLHKWHYNSKSQFKKPGPEGTGLYRAVIISGPPGIGKTTAAHLVARLEGYDVVESNASDTRSKKLVESGLKGVLDTSSLLGYFAGVGKDVEASKKKLVLIMDEVDGMSAGDRGGVGALAAICKKTNIPMILICNDRKLQKMRPFDFVTFDMPFRRPTVNDIRARIMTICYREGLKIPGAVIDALIEGSHADIRQIINMISTAKLDEEAMDFDKGKSMSKAWQKHVILKPWDITSKLLGGHMFAPNSTSTLNDKIELYFNDHEITPLMIQENYLKPSPTLANRYSGREKNLKALELADKAAESISDGDLVDRMIHGSQQQWGLMPTHAVFSTVRPSSYVSGSLAGHGQVEFTKWLGKLARFVKEIQGHMRLRSSADRHEIRQQYLPTLWLQLVNKMQVEGKEAVPDVIQLMDSYFLTKDDYDAIQELGLGPMDTGKVKIDSQAKATFTRIYNQMSHPLPFMKASSVVAPKKMAKEKPDLEEAIEESEEEAEDPSADKSIKQEEEEELDLSKDKYVKVPKKKAAPKKAAAAGKKKGKASKTESDEEQSDDDDSEDVKPKKGRGRGAAAGKKAAPRGRGKK
ncbi:MAG: hypothetical protein M1819_007434 [Sarea resinae]|nr:MAG: hypothetical protein M1819_007434 [Sarea resinae]